MKRIIFGVLILFLLIGCTQETTNMGDDVMMDEKAEEMMDDVEEEIIEDKTENIVGTDWKDITLKDVATGNTFKISDFKGKPILLESFAVWCPKCKKQQDTIKALHEDVGDSVISIGLNTDPNEDEAKVLEHIKRNGYDWLYAVSPTEFTQQLIDEFGVAIVNAPQVPVILICEDQSARLLQRGQKEVATLKSEIEGC